ncbi:hypothetical protein BGZ54_005665, partial [Gamsiella multidivaricata]
MVDHTHTSPSRPLVPQDNDEEGRLPQTHAGASDRARTESNGEEVQYADTTLVQEAEAVPSPAKVVFSIAAPLTVPRVAQLNPYEQILFHYWEAMWRDLEQVRVCWLNSSSTEEMTMWSQKWDRLKTEEAEMKQAIERVQAGNLSRDANEQLKLMQAHWMDLAGPAG